MTPQTRYLIRVRHAKNLNGAAADGQAVLTIPKAKPPPPSPRDTTHGVPPDTSRGQAPRDTTKP